VEGEGAVEVGVGPCSLSARRFELPTPSPTDSGHRPNLLIVASSEFPELTRGLQDISHGNGRLRFRRRAISAKVTRRADLRLPHM
jgi:hypothetical protein